MWPGTYPGLVCTLLSLLQGWQCGTSCWSAWGPSYSGRCHLFTKKVFWEISQLLQENIPISNNPVCFMNAPLQWSQTVIMWHQQKQTASMLLLVWGKLKKLKVYCSFYGNNVLLCTTCVKTPDFILRRSKPPSGYSDHQPDLVQDTQRHKIPLSVRRISTLFPCVSVAGPLGICTV